jgi:hypothetical protein
MMGGIEEMAREALIDRAQHGEDFALAEHGDDISTQSINETTAGQWDSFKRNPTIDPFDHQIGGDHYKHFAIQPVEYIIANNLGFCEGNVIKYITRYKRKNGKEDLKKAKHFIDLLIAMQDE